jgi:ABC-type oligopeptide transport system ATPase subunit
MPLLEIKDLSVHFDTDDGVVKAVDGITYSVDRGQTLGIVGESGSGKSVSSLTVMGLTRSRNARISGSIKFDGKELIDAPDADMRKLRGNDVAMIFQDPLSSLHPFYKVGAQIVEAVRSHRDVSKAQAWDRAIEMLGLVGIPEPRKRADAYPHEFSGGMRQRAMIAMALANNPKLLVADEPTTALDVTVQAQILELIERLQAEFDAAVVIITIAVSSSLCRRCSRSRICAWTVTSSAVVGSSAISTFGRSASAIAISARCRCPPENWCGGSDARRAACGIPTWSSTSTARDHASRRDAPVCSRYTSAIWLPTLKYGSSADIGSWNTIAAVAPRNRRSRSGSVSSTTVPAISIRPVSRAPVP